jgi:undecaprenyl-diphosphatase
MGDTSMNLIDHEIVCWLNNFAARSEYFDESVLLISHNYLLKTGLFTVLLAWLWFREDDRSADRRTRLVFGLVASWMAVLVARILSFAVPFSERPLRNSDLQFVLPYSMHRDAILGWSSFPSDNAALYFGIAACIFLVSRRAGILAFCHALLVVAFARIYLGYHYPSDILAGALIGIGAVSLIQVPRLKVFVTRMPIHWLQYHPQRFYAAFFLLIFLTATTFEPLYPLVHIAKVLTARWLAPVDS